MNFSRRMGQLDTSQVRKLFEAASRMKSPTDLSLGLPDFDAPSEVKNAAIDAIQNGKNRYTPTAGIVEFQKAVCESLQPEGLSPDRVMATAGASGGLICALLALVDEQTDVFMPDPYFITYPHMVRLAGGRLHLIDTYPTLRLTSERLEQSVRQTDPGSAKVLLFNSPVNPTGIAYTEEEIEKLARTARQLGVQVISDEVYDQFCYDFKHVSWLKYDKRAILIRTFGKSWGVTGWRCGFAAGPEACISAMIAIQQFVYVCVNAPAQWAAIQALKTDIGEHIAGYRKKRDRVYDRLSGCYPMEKPQGAFYAFAKIPGDPEHFLEACLKKEILIVPGNAFSQKNTHFRISYAVGDRTLERGIDLLLSICQ